MRLVLFDCDGTLVDSQHMIVAAMTAAFDSVGVLPPPREAILSIVGLSLPVAVAHLTDSVAGAPIDDLVAAYKKAFFDLRETAHEEPLYPGARAAIEALAAQPDTLLGVVTGKSRRGLTSILANHALTAHFVVSRTADDAPSKPHPAMVLEAMAEVGAGADATVVVGDTSFDMAMAVAAGVSGIGVTWGYHPRERLVDAGAATILDRFDEVPTAVARLIGGGER